MSISEARVLADFHLRQTANGWKCFYFHFNQNFSAALKVLCSNHGLRSFGGFCRGFSSLQEKIRYAVITGSYMVAVSPLQAWIVL